MNDSLTTEANMTQITIPAQVVNGHLQHEQSLAELEGQCVIVTLTVVPKDAANGKVPLEPQPQKLEETAEFDPEPPPWLEVENDVYFPMTVPGVSLGKVNVIVEQGNPSIILPEELPDE
jgi:hypothetical protein